MSCYLCSHPRGHTVDCPRAMSSVVVASAADKLHELGAAVRDYLALIDSNLSGLSTMAAVDAIDRARERMRKLI